jgi:hypothetical protein
MSPEIIAHPGKLVIHYGNSEKIKSLDANRKKKLVQFLHYPSSRATHGRLLGM